MGNVREHGNGCKYTLSKIILYLQNHPYAWASFKITLDNFNNFVHKHVKSELLAVWNKKVFFFQIPIFLVKLCNL